MRLTRFLTCTALLAALAACADESPAAAREGRALFAAQGCVACHGAQAEGTFMAPSLRGVARFWTHDALVAYFADPPTAVAKDARLAAFAQQFRTPMRPVAANAATRAALAEYVLSLD